MAPKTLKLKETGAHHLEGDIIFTRGPSTISRERLFTDLTLAGVIYVGEKHTDPDHHRIQLDIIRELKSRGLHVTVGMEMFDQSYQPILDQWSSGKLGMEAFLRQTHWYANWKYPISLYREILEFIQKHHIRLVALNIPFHLPAKIAIGGIDSLRPEEKRFLPAHIDTGNTAHRDYVKKIFESHRLPGRDDFTFFYEAQCAWEDGMAEAVARHLPGEGVMVVLVGNGHIYRHFGVPDRAFSRTRKPFRTLYPVAPGAELSGEAADYIWVTRLPAPKSGGR